MQVKPCPFCGMQPDIEEDEDCLYPSGAWLETKQGIRHYVPTRQAPPEQWCYTLHCVVHHGGCGAEIHGDNRQEAIDKWNRRTK